MEAPQTFEAVLHSLIDQALDQGVTAAEVLIDLAATAVQVLAFRQRDLSTEEMDRGFELLVSGMRAHLTAIQENPPQ